MGYDIHVVFNRKATWDVRSFTEGRILTDLPTKAIAVARANEIAIKERRGIIIHNQDNTVSEQNSWGRQVRRKYKVPPVKVSKPPKKDY